MGERRALCASYPVRYLRRKVYPGWTPPYPPWYTQGGHLYPPWYTRVYIGCYIPGCIPVYIGCYIPGWCIPGVVYTGYMPPYTMVGVPYWAICLPIHP